jgi:hypothetical protein
VGKRGHLSLLRALISKTPELHSPDLEKRTPNQVPSSQPLRKDIHFSYGNYGYYSLFSFSLSAFHNPRRAVESAVELGPEYPEKHPCFPRARKGEDEYNQEEEKTATSAELYCVVECGQRRKVASYGGSLSCVAFPA